MNRVERALIHVASDLTSLKFPWALVGGFAVSVRAEPRLTRDVDVVVAVGSDLEAERTVRDLSHRGWRVIELVEQEARGRVATARMALTGEGTDDALLDMLFASSGIESEVARAAEIVEVIPRIVIPVATRAHLIALKLLARDDRSRPQDADDLAALIRKASRKELDDARDALTLIMDRGFNRKRNLPELLEREIEASS